MQWKRCGYEIHWHVHIYTITVVNLKHLYIQGAYLKFQGIKYVIEHIQIR